MLPFAFLNINELPTCSCSSCIGTDYLLQTNIKSIFAAGDIETGPSSVVEVIGRAHNAAKEIHAYLRGIKPDSTEESVYPVPVIYESYNYNLRNYNTSRLNAKERIKSFDEVEKSLSDFEAVTEASRCLTCGPCYMCSVCLPNCDHKQLIAELKKNIFILKGPNNLSRELTEKGPLEFKIISNFALHILSTSITSIFAPIFAPTFAPTGNERFLLYTK